MHLPARCLGSVWKVRRPLSSTTTISPGSISRMYSASMRSSAHVSLAKMVAPLRSRPSTSGRKPSGSRAAEAVLDRAVRLVREEVDDHLGVARALEERAALFQITPQLLGIDQVAVVRDGDLTGGGARHHRLRVGEDGLPRRRVAGVADGRRAGQAGDGSLVEDVGDQAHGLVQVDGLAVPAGDAGRLLPAVLQRVDAEIAQVRRLGVGVDAENAALVVKLIVADERESHGPGGYRVKPSEATRVRLCGMADDDKEARIVEARMKLRERFLRKARPADKPMGSGKPDRHGMPKLPPGQTLTQGWPVLDLGRQPHVKLSEWELIADGAVEEPRRFSWKEFTEELPQVQEVSDFHCVTAWSKMDVPWEGVQLSTVLALARPKPDR